MARPADKTHWWPLWQAYLTFYRNPLPDALSDLTFARFVDANQPMHLLVAKKAGKMLGFASLIYHGSTWAWTDYAYLEDLFVSPEARGQGVGRALIEAVSATAKKAGSERLYWLTDRDNTTAQALYDRLAEKTDFILYRREP